AGARVRVIEEDFQAVVAAPAVDRQETDRAVVHGVVARVRQRRRVDKDGVVAAAALIQEGVDAIDRGPEGVPGEAYVGQGQVSRGGPGGEAESVDAHRQAGDGHAGGRRDVHPRAGVRAGQDGHAGAGTQEDYG